jgi:hypothetical protein
MIKYIFLLLISFSAFGQPLVEGVSGKVWNKKKTYPLENAKTYTYIAESTNDTARYFDPGQKRFLITVTATEIVPLPEKLLIEAEDVTSIVNAEVDPTKTKVYHIRQGAVISYGIRYFNKAKKLTINYARGNTGNGVLTFAFKLGNTVILTKDVQLPYTGGWSVWKDVTVDLPTTTGLMGDIGFTVTSQMQGAADLNLYEFE